MEIFTSRKPFHLNDQHCVKFLISRIPKQPLHFRSFTYCLSRYPALIINKFTVVIPIHFHAIIRQYSSLRIKPVFLFLLVAGYPVIDSHSSFYSFCPLPSPSPKRILKTFVHLARISLSDRVSSTLILHNISFSDCESSLCSSREISADLGPRLGRFDNLSREFLSVQYIRSPCYNPALSNRVCNGSALFAGAA